MIEDLEFRHDVQGSQFQARRGSDLVGVVDYRRRDRTVTITHTGTVPAARGQRAAERLTTWALDQLRSTGDAIVPVCPYTAHFLDEHPEYADLIA